MFRRTVRPEGGSDSRRCFHRALFVGSRPSRLMPSTKGQENSSTELFKTLPGLLKLRSGRQVCMRGWF